MRANERTPNVTTMAAAARDVATSRRAADDRRCGRTRLSLLAAPLVLALALTGCGDDTVTTEPASSDGSAATATTSTAVATETTETDESTEAAVGGTVEASGAVAHYPLEDGFESSVAGAPPLETIGEVNLVPDEAGESTVAQLASEQGRSVSGFTLDASDLIAPDVYTIAFRFSLDTSSQSWLKLVDFNDRERDEGFYADKGQFQFFGYPVHGGRAPLNGGPYTTVVLRRSADGQISWFVDGEQRGTVDDSENEYGVFDPLEINFFVDDMYGGEQAPGRVAWLSVYDEPLDDEAIADL